MHHLTNLTALNNQSRLHTLSNADKIVVNSTHGEERRNGSMLDVYVTVRENDVVNTLINTVLCLLAKRIECTS